MISKLLCPQRATDGRRGTTRDFAGTLWDACVLALSCVRLILSCVRLVLSCVRLVLVNYKIVDICKFTVNTFCTKTRLLNLKRN